VRSALASAASSQAARRSTISMTVCDQRSRAERAKRQRRADRRERRRHQYGAILDGLRRRFEDRANHA
jgi:hypothetical protein